MLEFDKNYLNIDRQFKEPYEHRTYSAISLAIEINNKELIKKIANIL